MDDLGVIGAALGHERPALFETAGGRFYMTCSCGYRTTNRRTVADAVGAAVHHVEKAVREYRKNGGVLPGQNPFLAARNAPSR